MPKFIQETRETLALARTTLESFQQVSEKANVNLENLEQFTGPLGQRADELYEELQRSAIELRRTLTNVSQFTESLQDGQGTIGRLVHDDELYVSIRNVVANAEEATKRLRPVIEDMRIFTDKIARDPSQLGVRGALDRRPSGLKTGVATAAAVAAPYILPSRALGANERLTIGHIGVGGMGGSHLRDSKSLMDRGVVNIAAVCDIDERRLENASRVAGPQADVYRDYRYVLQRDDIDAVIIATPDHWHAQQTVHAAESGKHVYVEKPACCTIAEGKAMIEACNRAKIAVQIGTHGLSHPESYLAHRYLANGNIGQGPPGRHLALSDPNGRNATGQRSSG
jgi:hypothetical protein